MQKSQSVLRGLPKNVDFFKFDELRHTSNLIGLVSGKPMHLYKIVRTSSKGGTRKVHWKVGHSRDS